MKENNIFASLVRGMDLGVEPIPGQPVLEILGNNRVIIENHQGVTLYLETQINVQVRDGEIQVKGSKLSIIQITDTQIVIMGIICSVHMCKGGHKT